MNTPAAFAILAGALSFSLALAQDKTPAGKLDLVEGDSLIEAKGAAPRIASTGEAIYPADTITTFAAAEVHVTMADGAHLSLRENTKVTITEYVADGGDEDRSILDLAKGTLRSITGWIGKYRREGYQIRTPQVTIGVRGTDHEPTYLPPGDPRGEPGTYDKVNEGSAFMQSQYGTVEVPPNRAAHFAPGKREPPRLLASVPAFFKPARNEQRFVARAREGVRTLDTQREARRQLVQQHRTQPPRTEKKGRPSERPGTRLEKLQEKKSQRQQRLEQRTPRIEKKAERPRERLQQRQRPEKRERFEKKD